MAKKSMPQHVRIWIYVGILIVVGLIVSAIVSVFFLPTPPSHFELAQEAYISGDFSTALTEFDRAVDENPNNPDYLIGRGLTYLQFENYAFALDDFNSAITLDPESNDTRPYLHGGYITMLAGEYDIAIDALTTAINRGNNSATVYSYRGLSFYNLEDYVSAIADLKTAIDLGETSPEVYKTLGDANYALGNHESALTAYTQYLELVPQPDADVIETIREINAQE